MTKFSNKWTVTFSIAIVVLALTLVGREWQSSQASALLTVTLPTIPTLPTLPTYPDDNGEFTVYQNQSTTLTVKTSAFEDNATFIHWIFPDDVTTPAVNEGKNEFLTPDRIVTVPPEEDADGNWTTDGSTTITVTLPADRLKYLGDGQITIVNNKDIAESEEEFGLWIVHVVSGKIFLPIISRDSR